MRFSKLEGRYEARLGDVSGKVVSSRLKAGPIRKLKLKEVVPISNIDLALDLNLRGTVAQVKTSLLAGMGKSSSSSSSSPATRRKAPRSTSRTRSGLAMVESALC